MAKQISSLSVGLFGNIAPFAGAMKAAIAPVRSFMGSIASAGSALLKFSGIGAAVGAGMDALNHIGDGFSYAANLEKTQIQFAALIGDSDKAANAIADLTEFAKSTPFELPGLIDASRKLLAMGVSNEKLLPSLKALGDVAAGVGQPLDEITEIFGRVQEEGKLSDRELREFSKNGIPVVDELAKHFGVTKQQIQQMTDAGQIGFADLQRAFADMTGPGGRFAGQMEQQAGSLGGLWTRLSGTVEEQLGNFASILIEAFDLKDGIRILNNGLTAAGTFVSKFIMFIAPTFQKIGSVAYAGFNAAYNFIAPIAQRIYEIVVYAWGRIVPVVTAAGQGILASAQNAFNSVYNFIAPIATAVYQVVADNWDAILTSVTGYVLSIWDVISSVWGVIVQLAQTVWDGVTAVWQWGCQLITGSSTDSAGTVAATFQSMIQAANWLRDGISTAFNVLGYVISHWQEGIELAGDMVILSFVRIGNQAEYIFGTVIPAIATWFANNWQEIFVDEFNFTTTVFSNLASNIVSIIKNIPGLIKGSVSFDQLWKPLTDGFTATLKELPNIPARQAGDLENALESQVNDLAKKYGDGLADHLADQQQKTQDAVKAIKSTLGDLATAPTIKKPIIPQPDPILPTLSPDNLTLAITPEIKRAKAIRVGSAEAQLARYAVPKLVIGPNGGAGAAPPGAARPPAAPQPGQPPQPQAPVAKASQGMKEAINDILNKTLDVLKDTNYWTRQIYQQNQNTQVVSL